MQKEEIKSKIDEIYSEYRKNYDGEYFMYECVDRDVLLSICETAEDKKISQEEFVELTNYVLAEMIKKLAVDFTPLKPSEDGKPVFKFSKMNANELRIEIEDKLSQIEDLEQYYDQSELTPEEEDRMVKHYRLIALLMSLAAKELFNRDFKMKDIDII